ncbi:MAG: PfkB family carbohydrate kinase [Acidimicrobiales bacterium]
MPTSGPRLLCCDTVLVDVVLSVSRIPERAGDVRATDQLVTTGGGFNAMSAAARFGQRVVYAGLLGTGPFGDLAAADLAREGIEAPLERHPALDTGICVVLVDADAERTFVTGAGAEGHVGRRDLDALAAAAGDVVLVSGYNVMYPGEAEVYLDWLAGLDEGVVVAFDPATRIADVPPVHLEAALARADWLLCNASEARALSGEADPTVAASSLARPDLAIVVRDGARGCVVALRPGGAAAVAGVAVEALDTNGAGDVHNGVFLAELLAGSPAPSAARWANAAAALAVTRRGPATGPTRAEVAGILAG